MIRSTLANLRGAGSLANELIQNADDAEGAHRLIFRFTDAYLEVLDDGDSCGQARVIGIESSGVAVQLRLP